MSQPRYQAFISYSHRDAGWAAWLHRALETYRVPRQLVGTAGAHGTVPPRLAPVFRDREELASASDLGREISAALADSANLIVICSPHAAVSRWVNEEVLAFQRLGRADRIFCLIVDGEPNAIDLPGRAAEECFCPALRFALDDDGALGIRRCEPIAADARLHGDGRGNARLKIIAGLLGVGLDALRQREHHRQQRRMFAITAAALLVMGVTSMLAVAAVVARDAAERRQKQAEELVGFMLGDLTRKLNEVNRLDILEDVADQSMRYFDRLAPSEHSRHTALGTARVLMNIGQVRLARGSAHEALNLFRRALASVEGIVPAAGDSKSIELHAESLNWIGVALWELGEQESAGASFASSRILLDQALQVSADTRLLKLQAFQSTNAARLMEARGEIDAAVVSYQAVLSAFERLASLEPANPSWQSELGYAHNNLGKVAIDRGQLAIGLEHYRADLRIKRSLADADPDDNGAREDLSRSLLFFTQILTKLGHHDHAVAAAAEARESLRGLAEFDPTQQRWQRLLLTAERQLAGLMLTGSTLDRAERHVDAAERISATLTALEGDGPRASLRSAEMQLLRGRLARANGNIADALARLDRVQAALPILAANGALRSAATKLQVEAAILRAELPAAEASADIATNLAHAQTVIASVGSRATDPDRIAAAARIDLLLGDSRSARQRLDTLQRIGYAEQGFVSALRAAGVAYEPAMVAEGAIPYPAQQLSNKERP